MRKRVRRILIAIGILILFIVGGLIYKNIYINSQEKSNETIVKKNVKIITSETDKDERPTKVLEDKLEFKKDLKYKKGDVIVSGITSEADAGYIRKVVNTKKKNGKYIVQTEPAYLTDVFEKAHIVKQIELTDAGMRFYKRCLQILDLTEITKNELKESFQDVLRIGITSSNGGLIQQDNIKHFIEHYDHVQYRIYEGSTYEILDLLLSHNIDLGIVRTPFDTSKVNTFYLEKEPMIVIGKKEYFKRPISKMKDLKKIPLIIHQRYLPLINDYSLNKHIQIQIKVTCDDSRTSLIWANSGIGVAIVPLSSLSLNYDSSLEYAYLEDKDLYTGIAFITRKNEETPILINQFIECFK